jgi:hypothetical protein
MREQEQTRASSVDDMVTREDGGRILHVAVVYGPNDVRCVTAAESRTALAVRLADYVRRHAGNQLWPDDARRLRRLLAARRFEAAVEHYFASVGGRWDEERLVIETVDVGPAQDAPPLQAAAERSNGDASTVQR